MVRHTLFGMLCAGTAVPGVYLLVTSSSGWHNVIGVIGVVFGLLVIPVVWKFSR